MLLFISKLLPALLFPIGMTLLLCLFAAWLAFRRGAWLAVVLSLLAFVVLGAASSQWVSNRLAVGLERQYPPARAYPQAAAIVLLGGGMMSPGAPRLLPETAQAGDRVLHAARLWRQGRAPKLVVTGGYISFLMSASGTEADQYAALLTELFDVPDKSILRLGDSRTTRDDAALSARLFDSTGMKKEILLVTSATHMPRAVALFRKHGFTVHPAPTDFGGTQNQPFLMFHLLPSAGALHQTSQVLHEYVGLWAYKMMGRI